MKMPLRNTTKMGLQACLAIILAECVSFYFQFEHGYWIALTSMALITQTWGESLKRSFERVGMTILGGCVGTMLYFLCPVNQELIVILLLVFIFFTVFLLPIYHLLGVFFLTCFVVFLFALMGDWNFYLLKARILDTAIGAFIALLVARFLFPLKTNIAELFIHYFYKIDAAVNGLLDEESHKLYQVHYYLAADFQKIRTDALAIRYELLFHRLNAQDFNTMLNHIELCTYFIGYLIDAYRWLADYLTIEDKRLLQAVASTTSHNIHALVLVLEKKQQAGILPATDVMTLLENEIKAFPKRFATLENNALGFYNLMYFFAQLNLNLGAVFSILNKKYF